VSIGLERGVVYLQPYNPNWSAEFENEKQNLLEVFGDRIIAIEHIGSTSISGLYAKPIIDMIAAIRSFDELQYFTEPLQKLGYDICPKECLLIGSFFQKAHDRVVHIILT
jgi:GrpB-like predicted nucleotidyltransferase (UPF0157 family)